MIKDCITCSIQRQTPEANTISPDNYISDYRRPEAPGSLGWLRAPGPIISFTDVADWANPERIFSPPRVGGGLAGNDVVLMDFDQGQADSFRVTTERATVVTSLLQL